MFQEKDASLKTLQDIRSIMDRSVRFLSLSGWSGIWAGCVALAGSLIAWGWMKELPGDYSIITVRFILLAVLVFALAFAGAYYFTLRNTRLQGGTLWNSASKRMVLHMAIPLAAGAVFALHFLYGQHIQYIVPICLAFYGLALINGSKYTLSDIKYLGLLEVGLGCVNLFIPQFGLLFWAAGFGVLHILYGIIVWNKYDKQFGKQATAS